MAAYAVLVMTLIVTYDVVARFLLGAGTKWATELTSYLMVAVVFFALAYTLREGSHIRITFLFVRLPRRVQDWSKLILSILFLGYTALLGWLGWDNAIASFTFKTTSRTGMDFVLWPYQLFIPLGLALLSLLLIRNIYTEIKNITHKLK